MIYLARRITDAIFGLFEDQMMLDDQHIKVLQLIRAWSQTCCVLFLLSTLSLAIGVIAETLAYGRGLQLGFVTMVGMLILELIYHQRKPM